MTLVHQGLAHHGRGVFHVLSTQIVLQEDGLREGTVGADKKEEQEYLQFFHGSLHLWSGIYRLIISLRLASGQHLSSPVPSREGLAR